MFNETMEKISQGKLQPLKATSTKRWEVATSNEKENCPKTTEMSYPLACGVIAPNDSDKLYETLVTATEQRSSHDILTLTTAYKECTDKESKNLNSQPVCSEPEELRKLEEPFEKLNDRQIKKARHQYFTVSMLNEICSFYKLPFKSRDSKAVLMSKIEEMTHECQCSVEG